MSEYLKDIESLKFHLDNGLDPNHYCSQETLLTESIKKENIAMIKLLVERGADVNLTNDFGSALISMSPLAIAIKIWNIEIIDYLLDQPAININNFYTSLGDSTILNEVCRLGRCDIFDKLIAKGADVNLTSKFGWSPLMVAVFNDNIDIVDRLLQCGCDVNYVSGNTYTAFHVAVRNYGNLAIIDRLISFGADFRFKDNNGSTPFLNACLSWNSEVIQRLIDIGCDINEPNDDGLTPLENMCKYQRIEEVKFLLEKGATINFDIESIMFRLVHGHNLETCADIKNLLKSYRKIHLY